MEAFFYNYNGNYNSLPKTLGEATTLHGVLRDACNVEAPILTVRYQQPFKFNYCYVPLFDRYYFVKRVDIMSNDVSRLELSCDILQTYKDAILASTGTVTQQDTPNKYINSRELKYDVRPVFEKINFPVSDLFSKEGSIIMVTIKGDK